ncbi:TetR/AcrR family transcriptional repressor of nem operon [Paraburkholderia sp. GAS199]|uniref:TetR/AcrR family transcriptional regulator n=1 Tax=Paraburkholderia sp. GAS199 TaxID=3035126 RepID=UPI003D256D79
MARPRGFDENEVLEAASAAFWSKGYEATSTRDLVQSTGLSQPSLYNAFGDKRGLYLRAMEHYLDHSVRERISRLESTLSPEQGVTMFFHEIIDRSIADPQKRGCMLVNSALEISSDDEAFRQTVATELTVIREFFLRGVSAVLGRKKSATVSADEAATNLLAVLIGIRVLVRVLPERAVLVAAIAPALQLLGLPPLPDPDPAV